MSYLMICDIFQEMCRIEIETLRNDHMTVDEATSLYNHLIALYVKFIENQVLLIKSYDYENQHHNPDIFDSIQQKVTQLRATLKKIIQNDQSRSVMNFQSNHEDTSELSDSFSRKQKMLTTMIDSLEWNDDLIATEAEILLDHLSSAYKLFVDNQHNMAFCVKNDSDFEKQLEKSSEIQKKVINFQKKLTKIIALEFNESVPASSAESTNKLGIKADVSKNETKSSSTATFWYTPYTIDEIFILTLLLISFVLFAYFLWKVFMNM